MEGLEPSHTYEPRTYKQLYQFAYRAIKMEKQAWPAYFSFVKSTWIFKYCTIMCI